MSRLHGDRVNGLVTGQAMGALRPIAYTPVVTWAGNTITTQSGFYLKTMGKLEIWVSFVETVGTATAALTITLPGTYTAVSLAGALNANIGTLCRAGVAGVACGLVATPGATATVTTNTATATGAVDTWFAYASIPTLT